MMQKRKGNVTQLKMAVGRKQFYIGSFPDELARELNSEIEMAEYLLNEEYTEKKRKLAEGFKKKFDKYK